MTALYAAMHYPHVFGAVLAESPSLWIAEGRFLQVQCSQGCESFQRDAAGAAGPSKWMQLHPSHKPPSLSLMAARAPCMHLSCCQALAREQGTGQPSGLGLCGRVASFASRPSALPSPLALQDMWQYKGALPERIFIGCGTAEYSATRDHER